ncbi:uncharacterized protein LOC131016023 isoform X2 [Salvia miltiorrhiza]|uniref:uncharacterized protein LOC131016023 isoform X2 n=1 Tax=Salvia miltiorrhiza TaxID=226208 RepID=UPI0025AC828C|nr:uncharacterized protein LOC131016023 isoform X2 [Salvia miltiorrhiza]
MASKLVFVFCLFSSLSFFLQLEAAKSHSNLNPQITVMGMVYCDICSNNSFSRHSYFLPVNRTTNKYGIYKLEVPSVDGVECARDKAVGSTCRATLLSTSSPACAVPSFRSTSDQISIKSKRANMCIYSLNALSYRPSKRDIALCGK